MLAAIQLHAQPDGSYRLTRGRQQAVWPTALVLFTRRRDVMGEHANNRLTDLAAIAGAVLVLALNVVLLLQTCGVPIPGLPALGRWVELFLLLVFALWLYFLPVLSAQALANPAAFHRFTWFNSWV